jgi:uncharacterized protein (DUF2062 family)
MERFINPNRKISRWYKRLIVRMRQHPPEEAVRGATIGMMTAFTPTVGIQIPILIGVWMLVHRRWNFSLPIALSCTFVTNVFTIGPIYYLFVVTGRVLLGRLDELQGFEVFNSRLAANASEQLSFWQSLWSGFVGLMDSFGLPMFVGCIPWAILIGGITWFLSDRIVKRFARKRALVQTRP